MRFKAIVTAATALSMTATPALAAASPAASLSVARAVRAHAPTDKASQFTFGTDFFLILIGLGIVAGTILVISDDDNSPRSS